MPSAWRSLNCGCCRRRGGHGLAVGPVRPCKYGILPVHLRNDELVQGNALAELGTLVGALLVALDSGPVEVGGAVRVVAGCCRMVASRVPEAPPVHLDLEVAWGRSG